MASNYTDNTGIEKPGTGDQSGTWGTTTNTNFDIIDRALNGKVTISLSGTTHTLDTSDGTLSDGMYKVLELGGSPSGTNTITITPNNAQKLYFVYNNSGQSVILTQGTGATTTTLENGKRGIVYADGNNNVELFPANDPSDLDPALVATITSVDAADMVFVVDTDDSNAIKKATITNAALQGPAGPAGADGPTGPTGPTGPSGTPSSTFNAVGSYGFFMYQPKANGPLVGQTAAGSQIRYTNTSATEYQASGLSGTGAGASNQSNLQSYCYAEGQWGSTVSGTWRNMGTGRASSSLANIQHQYRKTLNLWVRTS